MELWAVGINHKTAPLDVRARFAFGQDKLDHALHAVLDHSHHASEALILSTCNRSEVYCAGNPPDVDATLAWLARVGDVPVGFLQSHAYTLQGLDVARHAFRVASGLDSMVLGETQILGQMKTAVRLAQEAGTLGPALNQVFQRSFSVAKAVRSGTEIGAHSVSMVSGAMRIAAQLLGDLGRTRILFVGAGKMIELAASHFLAHKPSALAVANRTEQRAALLANRFGGEVLTLGDLPARLGDFDIVISSTSSRQPIIRRAEVEQAMARRAARPMFLLDLAVPRDIDPEVGGLDGVHLCSLDELAPVVQAGSACRAAAVAQAQDIIEKGLAEFAGWTMQRRKVPLIRQLNEQAELWRAQELSRARRLLARSDSVEDVLEALSNALMRKVLHGAFAELGTGDAAAYEQASCTVKRLFLRDPRSGRRALKAGAAGR